MAEEHMRSNGAVEVHGTTEVSYRPGWKAKVFARQTPALYLVLSGAATYTIGDTPYHLKTGDCFWVPQSIRTEIQPIKGERFVVRQIKLLIHDSELRAKMSKAYSPLPVDATMTSLFNYVFRFWNYRAPKNKVRIEHFLYSMLSLFFINNLHVEDADPTFALVMDYKAVTQKALYYIESNSYTNYTLEEMAQTLGYHKNYLCSAFSKDTGVSIVEYANFHKARLGVVYFFFWGVNVAETCVYLHFSSIDYFTRIFKRYVGISPSRFFKTCSSLSEEERVQIGMEEPILSYRAMPIDDLFAALRHIGQTMEEIRKRNSQ